MEQAYSIINSKLLMTNINQRQKRSTTFWLEKIWWCIFTISIFFFTGFVYYTVLYPHGNLFDVVSLGAVFATLGSTLVSIASLLCSKYYEEFLNCIDTLKNELIKQNINLKWIFLKKREILKKSKNEYLIYEISNPKVVFEIGAINLGVEIPAHKKDFDKLKLIRVLLRMKLFKNKYVNYLTKYTNSIMESGLYIWECVYHIIYSAIFYKFYRDIIITGTILFLSGLIATLIYPLILK